MIDAPPLSVASTHRLKNITTFQQDEMFALLSRHFEGVSSAQFERDLLEKSHVIFIHREGQLVGFSTLLAYESTFRNDIVSVIYSGDTIVAPEAWGSNALARAWIDTVNHLRTEYPRGPYYWLLLTSGFRTYRFLPVFWREFYPRDGAATPPARQSLLDHLASERFGRQFHPDSGIVRFHEPQRLRPALREIPPTRISNPHVAFFLEHNPGHGEGDELVCLTELCAGNLTPAGRRMVENPSV